MRDLTQERVRIKGPRGRIDAELCYPSDRASAAALLLNPHPLMGGRMDNNLIRALALALPSHGIATLRFDYAGVGESEGERIDVVASLEQFWNTGATASDPLMIDDGRACLEWLRHAVPVPLALVGYSFGAFVASMLVTAPVEADAIGLVLVAPTIQQHPFPMLDRARTPLLVVGCADDFATETSGLESWLEARPGSEHVILPGTDHFFRGQEDHVVAASTDFLQRAVAARNTETAA